MGGIVLGQGIVARGGTATHEIKRYCIPTVSSYVERGFTPTPAVHIHIDDFGLNEYHSTTARRVRSIALATAFLVEQLSARFNLRFAFNKVAITGPSRELVERAQVQLGLYARELNPTIINLGVGLALDKIKKIRGQGRPKGEVEEGKTMFSTDS